MLTHISLKNGLLLVALVTFSLGSQATFAMAKKPTIKNTPVSVKSSSNPLPLPDKAVISQTTRSEQSGQEQGSAANTPAKPAAEPAPEKTSETNSPQPAQSNAGLTLTGSLSMPENISPSPAANTTAPENAPTENPASKTESPAAPEPKKTQVVAMNLPLKSLGRQVSEQVVSDLPDLPTKPAIAFLSQMPHAGSYYNFNKLSPAATRNLGLLAFLLALVGLGLLGGYLNRAPHSKTLTAYPSTAIES